MPDSIPAQKMLEAAPAELTALAEKYEAVEKAFGKYYHPGQIWLVSDEIAVCEVYETNKNEFMGYEAVVNGKTTNWFMPTIEQAILKGLEQKHEGLNSQFTYFATKMLGIGEKEVVK